MTIQEISDAMNTLSSFLGRRDVPELTQDALDSRFGFRRADALVLCGSGLLCGADIMAEAIRNDVAKVYIIAGGAGHTTPDLRRRILTAFPDIPAQTVESASEAELFDLYLRRKYGLSADYLDCTSRNSGENVLNALSILKTHGLPCGNMILCQDAALQLRIDASLRLYAPEILPVNFACYEAETCASDGIISYRKAPGEMWDVDRFRSLLMGEIPRLHDTPEGYGPEGAGFIAHIDVPAEVLDAFSRLEQAFPGDVRKAVPSV